METFKTIIPGGYAVKKSTIPASYQNKKTTIRSGYVPLVSVIFGVFGQIGLAGIIHGTSTCSGTLRAKGNLAGSSAGTSTVSGTLSNPASSIAGTSTGTSTASATLSAKGFLQASAAGIAAVSGELIAKGALIGSSAGTSIATGTLGSAGVYTGLSEGTSTATGTLTGKGVLAGTSDGIAGTVGTLIAKGSIAGTSDGVATATGQLSAKGALSGSSAGTSTVTGTGTPRTFISGTSAGTSTTSATLVAKGALTSSSAGTSTVSGTLTNASSGFGEDGFWPLSDLNDSTANANHLTNNGSATFVAGKVADAVNLASASSQHLSRASNALLKTGNISFSFACWVMLASKGSSRTILCKGGSSAVDANDEYHLVFHNGIDRFRWLVSDGSGTLGFVDASTLGSPALDTWYFIVCWHDAAADWVRIQVNNGTVDETAYTTGGNPNGTSSFKIGLSDGSFYWNGKIDQVRYKKGLWTTQEKTDLYNGGNGV